MWRSEDNENSEFPFHHMGSRDWTHLISFDNKLLYLLSPDGDFRSWTDAFYNMKCPWVYKHKK